MTRLCTVGKKIILIFALTFLFQTKAFTQIEMQLTVPLGASFIFPYAEGTKLIQTKPYFIHYDAMYYSAVTYNVGALMQVGHRFDLKNERGVTSISLLADIGYSQEILRVLYYNSVKKYINAESTSLHTLNLGIIPKVNLYFPKMKIPFSVGLGGGVKIPFGARRTLITNLDEVTIENLSYKDIKERFLHPFIPYIKLTADTYYYVSKHIALTAGLYMAYNFGMRYDTDKLNAEGSDVNYPSNPLELTEYGYTSFDIGITLGISFGRPNPKSKL